MKVRASEQESSLLELLQWAQPNFNEVKGETEIPRRYALSGWQAHDYLCSVLFALLFVLCYLCSVICSLYSVICSLSSKKSALPHGTLGCCTIAHCILYFISTFRGWHLQNIIIQCITTRRSKLFPYPARTVAVYGVTVLHFVFPVICWLRPSCSRSA